MAFLKMAREKHGLTLRQMSAEIGISKAASGEIQARRDRDQG